MNKASVKALNFFPVKKVHKLLLLLCLIAIGSQSCKVQKTSGDFPRNYTKTDYVLGRLQEERADFEWLSARMKVTFDDGRQNLSSPAHLRVRKDSVIWISVTPVLGIEALRVLITTDSVHVLNRLDKTYQVFPISMAKQYTGTEEVNFRLLQDALAGNGILSYNKDYEASVVENKWILLQNNSRVNKEAILISPENFRIISNEIVRSQQNQQATILYSDHEKVSNQYIPKKIAATVTAPVQLKLQVEYSKITLNQPENINFQVPSNYERN